MNGNLSRKGEFMPSLTVNGIVTRYANYRDNDRILTLFTRERGLIPVGARGCRRPKSPILPASELFVSGEFVLFYNRERYSLESAEVREPYYPLREDIAKFSAGAYMLSLINEGLAAEQPNEKLLSLLLYALTFTAYSDIDPVDTAVAFAVKCLDTLGYRPALVRCASCGFDLRAEKTLHFSASAGGALCTACSRGFRQDAAEMSALSLEALRRILLLAPNEIGKVRLPERVRTELKHAVNDYAEHVLERKFKAFSCL